jgi:muramoyltetrapeptide carboxypeptidase LdcA involved in peptidoglycan recycling
MKLPKKLLPGDTVAIVSLSSGILGEKFASHQLNIAETRLKDIFKLKTKYMDNSLKGIAYISAHPEARADDLKQAMYDDDVKAILVATGGDDTFKTIPYLLEDSDFIKAVKTKPKIFLGFSDSTNNHLMFYKLGMPTFYGIDFLSDFGEMNTDMLPYTEKSINDIFFGDGNKIEIQSSPVWYRKRLKYTEDQVGTSRDMIDEEHGYESILGSSQVEQVTGQLFGGCVESLYT